MPSLPSPRLPGVNVLPPDASGPQYARWRRGVKSAIVAKGIWGHCDGSTPMPMPEAGPNFFAPVTSTNPQPQLLEERRAWVKKDRDVKLDLFLSVADDIKLEVFEVGPPLPPSSMSAKEMLEALDERFASFKFEEYHHVFCHFLNLHIDEFSNLEDFNAEFQATLDDLLDHGQPMSNAQACSAYFSKLRCTQNPWVAKKLKEWDTTEPRLAELMKDSPPWVVIRPLTTKPSSQQSVPESIPEEKLVETPVHSDGEETPSEHSEVATVSSKSSHSRQSSRSTSHSQEITVHASYEDLTELDAFPNVPAGKLPAVPIPKRLSSKNSISKIAPLPPINRPLPPLPPDAEKFKSSSKPNSRTGSPNPSATPKTSLEISLKVPTPPASSSSRPTTPQALEQIHPALRPSPSTPPTAIHPALRPSTANASSPSASGSSHISSAMRPKTPSLTPPIIQSDFLSSSPNLNLTLPSTTFDLNKRPQSSRSAIAPQPSMETFSTWPPITSKPPNPLLRVESSNSSIISLPLQGATMPEYKDATIVERPKQDSEKRKSSLKVEHKATRSLSPSRTFVTRLSSEISEEEKKSRKRSMSWSIKARLSAKHGVKEII